MTHNNPAAASTSDPVTPEMVVAGSRVARLGFGIHVSPWALKEIYLAMKHAEKSHDDE